MYLDATTKSLEIKLAGAITTNQLPWTVDYGEVADDNTASSPKNGDGATNSTTVVTMVAAPGASLVREVLHLSVFNADAASATVTIQENDNGTTRIVAKAILAVGYTLCYESPMGWYTLDTNGARASFFSQTVTISGTVTANAGTNLNTSALALEAGGNLATIAGAVKNEDAASATADPGIVVQFIQKAVPADTAGTDGDYAPPQMSGGRVWVDASGKTLTVASHAVTNAGSFAVQVDGAALTSLQLIDDAVSGAGFNVTQMNGANLLMGNGVSGTGVQRVTIASDSTGQIAIAAGSAVIGHVIVDSGTITTVSTVTNVATIGTSVTPGTSAAHLGKAEDAAHSSGDTGVMTLAVRSNTAASTSGTDGDYQPLITNTTGHLWVDASGQTLTVAAHNVTNAGTFAVQATIASGATSIAKAEDVASADADVGVPSMAVRKATPANTSGTDGDYEFLQMSAGRLWVDASGVSLTVGAHAVTNAGTFAVQAAITAASGSIASGAVASGAVASGAFASGSISAGAVAAGATSFVKLEDVASADADAGVPAMAVRKATPANTSGTDGDYEMLQMSAGRLWCSAVIDTALPAGTAVIGHVIVDSGTITTVSTVTSVSQWAGTAIDVNSGNKGNGTLRVVLATDQPALTNPLLTTPKGIQDSGGTDMTDTATHTLKVSPKQVLTASAPSQVASSASSVTLLASNSARMCATIYNSSTQILYVKFGTTASATSFTIAMAASSYAEFPATLYGTGRIDGLWASANGNAYVGEFSNP